MKGENTGRVMAATIVAIVFLGFGLTLLAQYIRSGELGYAFWANIMFIVCGFNTAYTAGELLEK